KAPRTAAKQAGVPGISDSKSLMPTVEALRRSPGVAERAEAAEAYVIPYLDLSSDVHAGEPSFNGRYEDEEEYCVYEDIPLDRSGKSEWVLAVTAHASNLVIV